MPSDLDSPPARQDRRKERTRAALLGAGRRLLGEGRDAHASIQTITDLADVGFGSFHNHFASKEQLFDDAAAAAIDDYFAWLDARLPADLDPVERVLETVRLTGRLAGEEPELATILGRRLGHLEDEADPRRQRIEADLHAAVTARGTEPGTLEFAILATATLGAIVAVLRRALTLTAEETAHASEALAQAVLRILTPHVAQTESRVTDPEAKVTKDDRTD